MATVSKGELRARAAYIAAKKAEREARAKTAAARDRLHEIVSARREQIVATGHERGLARHRARMERQWRLLVWRHVGRRPLARIAKAEGVSVSAIRLALQKATRTYGVAGLDDRASPRYWARVLRVVKAIHEQRAYGYRIATSEDHARAAEALTKLERDHPAP